MIYSAKTGKGENRKGGRRDWGVRIPVYIRIEKCNVNEYTARSEIIKIYIKAAIVQI